MWLNLKKNALFFEFNHKGVAVTALYIRVSKMVNANFPIVRGKVNLRLRFLKNLG